MKILSGIILLAGLACIPFFGVSAQTMPEVMDNGSLEEQKAYLEERMNNYNGYRAVREDIFLKILKNGVDSLNAAKQEISKLEETGLQKDEEIGTLNNSLNTAREELADAIQNRDSLVLFGIVMAKSLYNMILWGIILGMVIILVIGGIILSRNVSSLKEMKNNLENTAEEFEEFRKKSREKTEQMVINHFNEIKKLREGR